MNCAIIICKYSGFLFERMWLGVWHQVPAGHELGMWEKGIKATWTKE